MPQVGELAKKEVARAPAAGGDSVQLERLISTNRDQAAEIADLQKKAAQREALIGGLQAQLATAKLQATQATQSTQQIAAVERDALIAQHQQMLQQVGA